MAHDRHIVARRGLLGLLLAAVAVPRAAFAAPPPLQIGVMPYLSTDRLIAGHQSLRHFLEVAFGRPAALSTAPDFPRFQERTLAGEYDFIITGPPLAWAAYRAGVAVPIATSVRPLRISVVVAPNSPVKTLADLRGKTIGVLPPPSFAPAILADMFRAHGLKLGTDVAPRYESTPYNSVLAVTLGELDAAAYPNVSLPSLPAELLSRIRNVEVSADFPSVMFCARLSSALPPPEAMQADLFRFVRETPEGALFLREFGHEGLVAPNLQALKILDRLLPENR